MLELGADPNGMDEEGRTPLHILTVNGQFFFSKRSLGLFKTLVNAGRNLDYVYDSGETVISIVKEVLYEYQHDNITQEIQPQEYYKSLVIKSTVFPLSCLCARVIRSGIRFDEDRIPFTLQPFFSRHSVSR